MSIPQQPQYKEMSGMFVHTPQNPEFGHYSNNDSVSIYSQYYHLATLATFCEALTSDEIRSKAGPRQTQES